MANQEIKDLTTIVTVAGTEVAEIQDAAGNSWKVALSRIAGLATGISGTDYDISSSNQTADISTLTAAGAGTLGRYTWHSGDGSNTFAFTGTAGITIDGIASSEYIGEGTGHLDLYVVSTSACLTINRGEIWDNDGGAFSKCQWAKKLNGTSQYDAWDYQVGDGTTQLNPTQTFLLIPTAYRNFNVAQCGYEPTSSGIPAAITDITTSAGDVDGAGIAYTGSNQVTIIINYGFNTSGSNNYGYSYGYNGRWTNSYPKIT